MMKTIIITGQTASGKTRLAENLQIKIGGEIISADSRTVYRQIPIGSGRYGNSREIPYHLVSILDVGERYSVKDFLLSAHNIIDDIKNKEKQPIVCGGTVLFAERLIKGMKAAPDPDNFFRSRMNIISDYHGREYLHELLSDRDPEAAQKVHPSNLNIMIRYLEKAYLSESTNVPDIEPLSDAECFFITRNDDSLRKMIEIRTDDMLSRGLVEEGRILLESGFAPSDHGLDSIGYDRIALYLSGDINRETMREKIINDTFKLARSQRKWIGRFPNREINLDEMRYDEALDEILLSSQDV